MKLLTKEEIIAAIEEITDCSNKSEQEIDRLIDKFSIYGFLGPNGAGKSTTMKMLLGLTAPTKGSFTIDGKQFPNDRLKILREPFCPYGTAST